MKILNHGMFGLLATLAVMALPARADFSYANCPAVTGSEFAIDTLLRNGSDATTQEPLKMAFDMDAQGNVDVYFTQRYGKVRRYNGATKTTVTIADFGYPTDSVPVVSSNPTSTLGLHGIALDPGFKTNHWVYLYGALGRNASTWSITRYTLAGTTLNLSSARVIFQISAPSSSQHMAGTIRFDKFGNLWITVADNGGATFPTSFEGSNLYKASNTNSYFGKILRIKPRAFADTDPRATPGAGSTYDIPAGNLFPVGTDKTLPEIYVMGDRNPYTLNLDSVRNAVVWGEVGPDNFSNGSTNPSQMTEEYNFTTTPGYFGWPYWAGNQINLPTQPLPAGSTPAAPINDRSDNTGLTNLPPARPAIIPYGKDCALSGPVYYYDPNLASTSKFPPHFDGKWFLGEFNKGWIDAVDLNDAGTAVDERKKIFSAGSSASGYLARFPAIPASNGMLELQMGPDGALYVMNYGGYRTTSASTGIYRIRYTGTCRPGPSEYVSSVKSSRIRALSLMKIDGSFLEILQDGAHRVELRDLAGKTVWKQSGQGRARYDLRSMGQRKGIMILTVSSPYGTASRKLVR